MSRPGAASGGVGDLGYEEVDGGSVSSVSVSSGGDLAVYSGGAVAGLTVGEQVRRLPLCRHDSSGATIGGYVEVDGGSVTTAAITSGGDVTIHSGGTVIAMTVGAKADAFLYSGTISGATVSGYQEIDGGVALRRHGGERRRPGRAFRRSGQRHHGGAGRLCVRLVGIGQRRRGGWLSGDRHSRRRHRHHRCRAAAPRRSCRAAWRRTPAWRAAARRSAGRRRARTARLSFVGSGGRLALTSGAIVNAVLSGFAAGDTLNLSAVSFAHATVAYSGSTLSVTDGTHSVTPHPAGPIRRRRPSMTPATAPAGPW